MTSDGSRRMVAIVGSRGYPSTYGGFETFVRRLAPYLSDQGLDVVVYGRATEPGGDERVRKVRTWGIDTPKLSTLTFGLTASLHSVIGRRPDVALVLNVANGFWLPILRTSRIPTVVNPDGIEWEREKWSPLGRRVFFEGAKMTARYADHLVVDSQAIGDVWRNRFGTDSTFIPYGADIHPEPPAHGPAARLRELGLSDEPFVLVVARLVPENNVDMVLDAMASLDHRHRLVVVGSAVTETAVERRLKEGLENTLWLGHIHDQQLLTALWQTCAIYVHGHSVGGTNPALLQALGAGAPVVAFRSVYNEEVLGPHSWRLFSDAPELAKHVEQTLADEDMRRQLKHAAVARIRSHYLWDDVLHRYHVLLREAMGEQGS